MKFKKKELDIGAQAQFLQEIDRKIKKADLKSKRKGTILELKLEDEGVSCDSLMINSSYTGDEVAFAMGLHRDLGEENIIKIKLHFYCQEKALRARVFPEEWYTVVGDEFGSE